MNNNQTGAKKIFDLEDRTYEFAKNILALCQSIPKNQVNINLVSQISRSGTSVGANYREANETDTKKDFHNRIRICRKEAKETHYWLRLIIEVNPPLKEKTNPLIQESIELVKIFAAIMEKSKQF